MTASGHIIEAAEPPPVQFEDRLAIEEGHMHHTSPRLPLMPFFYIRLKNDWSCINWLSSRFPNAMCCAATCQLSFEATLYGEQAHSLPQSLCG